MRFLAWSIVAASLLMAATFSLAQMHGMQGRGMMGGGMMGGDGTRGMSMTRHRYVMRHGIDSLYASKTNPLQPTANNTQAGRQSYELYCASCHGPSGRGDGPAGENLNPRPTNIAAFSKMPMASDAYLYWTIAEGGSPVGSAMPPFKDALDETQIWQLILSLRQME
ncbi:MAG TPA: cytochrome c [Halomonas sp.]|nr:cytochrome c [Halomonas sp.]